MVHPAMGTRKPATNGLRTQARPSGENRRHTGFEHLIQSALGHSSGRSAQASPRAGTSGQPPARGISQASGRRAARVQPFLAVSTMQGDTRASSVDQADGSRGIG